MIDFYFSYIAHIVEDFCSVEPVTHPPEIVETRPLPDVDEDKVRKSYRTTESAILAGKLPIRRS